MKYLKQFGKILGAGITALVLLNILFAFYFLTPMYEDSVFGNTDYNAPANAPWIQMDEGISWGRFDSQGFNNPAVVEKPDILILGSSHMEATYVRQDQLLSQQLQQLLGEDVSVYNMGISGNNPRKCLQYLPETLKIYENTPELIVMEFNEVSMSQADVAGILEGSIPSIYAPKPRWLRPVLGLPFIRQLAHQKNAGLLDLLNPPRKPDPASAWQDTPQAVLPADSPQGEVYEPLFAYLDQVTAEKNTQLLIFYHPVASLQPDGSVLFPRDPMTEVFSRKCQEHGVGFLDLTDKFENMYREDHNLPHGFVTGRIGTGHLNAHGHRAAAQEIARWISEKEEP